MNTRNILKTIVLLPVVALLGTVFYAILLSVIMLSYFVGFVMLPTKLYDYLNKLDEYRRIKSKEAE
jgi:hypothetical protein